METPEERHQNWHDMMKQHMTREYAQETIELMKGYKWSTYPSKPDDSLDKLFDPESPFIEKADTEHDKFHEYYMEKLQKIKERQTKIKKYQEILNKPSKGSGYARQVAKQKRDDCVRAVKHDSLVVKQMQQAVERELKILKTDLNLTALHLRALSNDMTLEEYHAWQLSQAC